jgi:ATP-dependent Lon protease
MDQFNIPDSIRDFIISNYAREAGVRGLKKFTNRIMEKIAFKIVSDPAIKVVLTEETLQDFIGPPIFGSKRIY